MAQRIFYIWRLVNKVIVTWLVRTYHGAAAPPEAWRHQDEGD
jgi:hypothetical protein